MPKTLRLSRMMGWKNDENTFFVGEPSQMGWFLKEKKRIHIFALGDVGSMLLAGLKLLGEDCISEIGVYDVREHVSERFEFEMNQILPQGRGMSLPPVVELKEEELFNCDVFLFCASLRVPPVGEGGDVRMAQFGANSGLVRNIAGRAAACSYPGLFAVVSDPVDPLCRAAVDAGLSPARVKGYGLGVMNARASYYAAKEARFASYLESGRAYGPHGEDLVIANSLEDYDDGLSRELTRLTVRANLVMRDMGFKPYIAPALSSGALSVLATLRGEWNYSSSWFDGVFFGARNRCTPQGVQVEDPELPEALYDRCLAAYENLKVIL